MDTGESSDRTQKLKRMIRDELDAREGPKDYEFVESDDPGVHLVLEEEDETRRYHVTLENRPDGEPKTHWSYLGTDQDE